jgi:hypothetical protein
MKRARKKDPPETKTPARAATLAGVEAEKSRAAQKSFYSAAMGRAIISYRVGPDLLIQSFALAEVLA